MILSFTGTRKGMTALQKDRVRELLRQHRPRAVVHGDCIGADSDFHHLAVEYAVETQSPISFIIRPGCDRAGNSPERAHRGEDVPRFCSLMIHPVKPYLERNFKIAQDGDVLIATPAEPQERFAGSGTWATCRYMHDLKKSIQVVLPDGRLVGFIPRRSSRV